MDGRVGMQRIVGVCGRIGQSAEHGCLEMRSLVQTGGIGAGQDADHQSAAKNAARTTQSFLSLHPEKKIGSLKNGTQVKYDYLVDNWLLMFKRKTSIDERRDWITNYNQI